MNRQDDMKKSLWFYYENTNCKFCDLLNVIDFTNRRNSVSENSQNIRSTERAK